MIQDGILYTSSRLVGTSVEDYAEILRNKYTDTIDNVKTKNSRQRRNSPNSLNYRGMSIGYHF